MRIHHPPKAGISDVCDISCSCVLRRATDEISGLAALSAYLAPHPTRLGYADRLARGRSIGSGMVEGAIKQLINRRMKRTGARWRVEHVGPLVELIALADQPEWHHLWAA